MSMADDAGGSEAESAGTFVGFADQARVAEGPLAAVAVALWRLQGGRPDARRLAFDRRTGRVVDLDLRGSEADVLARYSPPPKPPVPRGRPKLGVVAREVTLLPRHWDWLAAQPGGASVTLRRLVEVARKADAETGEARRRAEAAYRFMTAMAGDLAGYEAAARALFAGDLQAFEQAISSWPPDLAEEAFRIWRG
jgi:hypothetical protein